MFTLIAGLAMFNTLAMIVLEKTKDIAILRSMGYTREDISRIFLWQAAIVLAIGTRPRLHRRRRRHLRRLPVPAADHGHLHDPQVPGRSGRSWHYVEAVVTAVLMVMVASLVPSRRAARLEPGDIIRGTAQ